MLFAALPANAATITEFPVPTAGSDPLVITAGPDSNLWFTEYKGNKIGRITTAGVITEFPIPTAGSDPRGITAGPDGNLWFTEFSGNNIGRFVQQAQNTETWTGSLSFTLKLTSEKEDTGGNRTLVTSRETFGGAMNFYWDRTSKTPTPGPDGCESELLGSDGSLICFTAVMGPSSENGRTRKGSISVVATGYIVKIIQGQPAKGIIYPSGKGSYGNDDSGNMNSISLSGTIGGGYLSTNHSLVTFSGTIPTTHLAR